MLASAERCVFRSQSVSLAGHGVNPDGVQRRMRGPEISTSEISAWRAVVRVLRSTAAGALHSLTSVIFPADCRVCGLPLSGFSLLPVCNSCWNNLPKQSGALCARCGEAIQVLPGPDPGPCRLCRAAPPPFEKAVAHGVYAGKLRTFVHLLKYDGMEPLARRLGALAGREALAIADLPDHLVLVPVPLWAAKGRQRGFNQAEMLARGAMAEMQRLRPVMRLQLAVDALERRRATESQAALSAHQRRVNVRGAFFVSRPAGIDGRDVLLIDDIYTSGATARACTRALRSAGAQRVWVATVARAQREDAAQQLVGMDFRSVAEAQNADPAEPPMELDVAFWEEGR